MEWSRSRDWKNFHLLPFALGLGATIEKSREGKLFLFRVAPLSQLSLAEEG